MTLLRTACALAIVALVGACAPTETKQAKSMKPSGFLHDPSQLRPGAPGEALLLYRSEGLNLAPYPKMMLDRVEVWDDARARGELREDKQKLADLLYATVLTRVRSYYVMTQTPGPDTIRVRIGLSEATASSPTMDVLSMMGPVTGTVSEAHEVATGTQAFVGAASAEAEVLDSTTGRVLLAAADRRVGQKAFTGSTGSWSDVQNAFIVWADRLVARLQAEGGPRRPLPYWAQPR
jgi:hypothetical protein